MGISDEICNRTRKTRISDGGNICGSPRSKALGLMFRSRVETPLIFIFDKERRHGLHMLFVFCAIDVLFLDKDRKVVDSKEQFRPFTFYTPKKPCSYIIELPAGAIKKSRTRIGDKIGF